MYPLIVFLVSALLCALALLVFRGKRDSWFDVFLKSITVAFCALGFIRLWLPDAFAFVYNGAYINGENVKNADFLQSILRWGAFASYSVLPMAVFYKGRFFRNVASYFCLPFSIACAFYFNDFMGYFLIDKRLGVHFDVSVWLRYTMFILELVFAISIPILLQIKKRHYLDVKNPREWVKFIGGLLLIIPITMPSYMLQSLIGFVDNDEPPILGTMHIVWIIITLVFIIALYYAFRFKSYEERLMLCMFLTLVLFFEYNSFYLSGITIKRLPFQLCNIASYFYLIFMVFKLKKMFHFCFLANIVGTIIAIFVFDLAEGYLCMNNVNYMIEHTLVLAIPALCMGLRIFPRVTLKSFKYYFIGFTSFFVSVFALGTIFNARIENKVDKVNYFYMLDRDFLFGRENGIIKPLNFLQNWCVEIGGLEFYPLIPLVVYLGFTFGCFLFYLLVRYLYKFEDDHLDLRRSSIDLYERISKKKSKRPKDFID